jgi:hypothetical protein
MKRQGIRFLLGALAALLAAGCSQETIESAKQDIDRNTETVEREAKRIERQAKPVIEAAKPVVKPVAEAVGRAADRKLDQAKIGGRVLAALRVNANLPKTIRGMPTRTVKASNCAARSRPRSRSVSPNASRGTRSARTSPCKMT